VRKKKRHEIKERDNEEERKWPQEYPHPFRQIFGYTYDDQFG